MSDFQSDIERQYEAYCKIAEEHGFIDLNAKKNGFRCTTKSNEFHAGWIAFTGAVSAMRDDQQAEINQLQLQINEMAVVGLSQESELNKKDERAHNLYYENANLQMLVEEKNKRIEELKVQLSLQRDRNKALEVELTNSRNYGDSLHSQLTNMEQCYIGMKKERDGAVYLKNEHRTRRVQLSKKLTQKSLRLTDSEFEYKRIKGLQAKDCLQIMRLTARNEKLRNELKALRGEHEN